jgi:hypothetical protein
MTHHDPICSMCGQDDPEVDEATELCPSCFEWTFDEPMP